MEIREARDSDVEALRDLFIQVYGENYPYSDFYDTEWLKKSVYDDDTLMLVALHDTHLVGTGTVILNAGGYDDLVGELGRLVVEPTKRARGAAKALVDALIRRMERKVLFSFSETRTVHPGAQRLAEEVGWRVIGFEPMKYQLAQRESVAIYAHLQPMAVELRRNNPRVIPEVAVLADTALRNLSLPADAIVEEEPDGYPTEREFETARLRERGVTPLLRIERGRVRNREIFGNFSLAHGFFNIADSDTHYLVARDKEAVLGAVGFTYDPIDRKIRIFELIEFDDAVKGFLLSQVDKLAREEFQAAYQEVDVSAYSPRMQRTLERLGFVPVAYCPSMVFENVERLDVIRMAKINFRYEPGPMRLLEGPMRMREIVERGFEDRLLGMTITEGVRHASIFRDLPEGDLYHLARVCSLRARKAGEQIIREGDMTDRLYILVDGHAEVRYQDRILGYVKPGEIVGEMSLVERHTRRSADVTLTTDATVIEIESAQLHHVMEKHPRLGYIVMQNLARSLSQKLRSTR